MGSITDDTFQQQPRIFNVPARNTPYFTPAQQPPSGTASDPQPDGKSIPKLFQPLTIRGVTFQNRLWVSPMCQYSAEDGHLTDWHLTHLGGIIQRGPGLTFVEATSITPEGRITPEDSGLWQDSQIAPLKRIVDFAHSQNQKVAIQIGHAGRKGSTTAPWLSMGATAFEEANGWPENVLAPSAIPFSDTYPRPKELTLEGIQRLKTAFVSTAMRAVRAGFDVVEVHAAHGYLLHEFLSPVSNQRTDQYGGSFENRTRLVLEIVEAVRGSIPNDMPLFVRISATDWLEEVEGISESWTVEQSAQLAHLLVERGADLLDVSTGGVSKQQKIKGGPGYQAPFAKHIKSEVKDKLLVTSVGSINDGSLANEFIEEGGLDAIFVGRNFQANPGTVWQFAKDLGVEIKLANQIEWGFGGRGGKKSKK